MAYRNFMWRQTNPDKRSLQRKKWKIRNKLRLLGYLPNYNDPMNIDQEMIWEQINEGNFSFWDSIKKKQGHDGGDKEKQMKPLEVSHEKRLLMRAKQNAKDGNYDFDLDLEDIVIPKVCPYLQIPLLLDYEERYSQFYFSLDRIDSTKGYVKGNVQVISRLANTMKNNATIEQLLTFANSIKILHS